jgi:hypothetical protein
MNAVEIEEAVSRLAESPFDPEEFPFAFLEAFGNKPTTIKRLKSNSSNQSDLPGGMLQRNNIHLKVCAEGEVTATLTALRESPATTRQKVKFILATDGKCFEAENLADGETIACDYPDFHDHFGFFLALAGITTVKQIRENAFDIKATGRLNRLYVELLKDNPDWDKADRREEMNHFMARLIFCFFAEDTNIFHSEGVFTQTIAQISAGDASNTHEVLSEFFRAMCTPLKDRESAKIRNWVNGFPYVNGGLFSGWVEVPRFSKIARSYLLHVGNLDWKQINPDIFGSMIQAVADEEERGALGMHYTSVPNILKVLNPLFLDDLRTQLEAAGDNARKLLNLRQRLAKIRVFDPACGSGNFLVIAYKEMRSLEATINQRRNEPDRRSDIPLTNFRGIELRHFAAEIARLALIIAEYQCDVLYRGARLALAEFLPLKAENWITCGNALRLDWLSLCPPTGTGVKLVAEDLFSTPLDQTEIDFENEGGETYICGNPQFKGARKQTKLQKEDMSILFDGHNDYKDCDYVTAWFLKAAKFSQYCDIKFAFVSTSSISQGEQVAHLWSRLYELGCHIIFAHQGFKWKNNAANNAGVHCVIIGVGKAKPSICKLYNEETVREVASISPYLISGSELYVKAQDRSIYCELGKMVMGSMARDGGNLILTREEALQILESHPSARYIVKGLLGSNELIHYRNRCCIWIEDSTLELGTSIPEIAERINRVRELRENSSAKTTNGYASIPHKFAQRAHKDVRSMIVAATSSENRPYLPADLLDAQNIISNAAYAVYDAELWELAIVISKMHIVWIESICGKLETRLRYSSTLGWNTFPVPTLTDQNKADLTRCAEDILLARERYFPATIAEMYDPDRMDSEFPLVREAHDRNDEILERIYIGRCFKNDTERLEKLFELYIKMTTQQSPPKKPSTRKPKVT